MAVHVGLVRKQADMASKPESACPVVIGENSHHGVFPIREQNIAWNDWNVVAGDLENGMVELVTFTQAEAYPSCCQNTTTLLMIFLKAKCECDANRE